MRKRHLFQHNAPGVKRHFLTFDASRFHYRTLLPKAEFHEDKVRLFCHELHEFHQFGVHIFVSIRGIRGKIKTVR